MKTALLCLAAVLISAVSSLPVSSDDDSRLSANSELTNQEEDLKRLADKSSHSSVALEYSSSRSQHFDSSNGKTHVSGILENKLVDPMSGELLRRLQQQLTGDQLEGEPLHEKIDSQLDIPAKNIHKEWTDEKDVPEDTQTVTEAPEVEEAEVEEPEVVQEEPDVSSETAGQDQPEVDDKRKEGDEEEDEEALVPWPEVLPPIQVARVLLKTGDVDGFSRALEALVAGGAMSQPEAVLYDEAVAEAYFAMQGLATEPQDGEENLAESRPAEMGVGEEGEDDDALSRQDLEQLYREAVLKGDESAEAALREFISSVVDMAESGQLSEGEVSDIVDALNSIVDEKSATVTNKSQLSTKEEIADEGQGKEDKQKEDKE